MAGDFAHPPFSERVRRLQLLEIVAVRKPIIPQDVAVVPEFFEQGPQDGSLGRPGEP